MTCDRADNRSAKRTRSGALACLAVAFVLLAQTAAAQQAPQPLPSDPSAAPAAPAKPRDTGFFEAIGRWFDEGAANFRSHLRGAKDRIDDLGDKAASASKSFGDTAAEASKATVDVTKNAVDAVTKLPNTRVIQGRQTCAIAPNGAPDCQSAAETLCRSRGFSTGRSLDSTSAEKCPPRTWLTGRQGKEAECTTETFISRAMCQ